MRRPCCMDADFGGLSVFSGLAPYVREADDQDFGQEGLSKAFFPSFSKAREMGGNTIKNQGGQEGEEDYIMSAIKFNQRT